MVGWTDKEVPEQLGHRGFISLKAGTLGRILHEGRFGVGPFHGGTAGDDRTGPRGSSVSIGRFLPWKSDDNWSILDQRVPNYTRCTSLLKVFVTFFLFCIVPRA